MVLRILILEINGQLIGQLGDENLGSFVQPQKEVIEALGDFILPLRVALQPNDPTVFRAFQPLYQPIIHLICRGHQAWRPLRFF